MEQVLRRRGATQVFLTGVSTSGGVEATARQAYDYGYNVALVVDAMTDANPDAHRHGIENVFQKIGGDRDHRYPIEAIGNDATLMDRKGVVWSIEGVSLSSTDFKLTHYRIPGPLTRFHPWTYLDATTRWRRLWARTARGCISP